MTRPVETPPHLGAEDGESASKPPPLQLDLPAVRPGAELSSQTPAERSRRRPRGRAQALGLTLGGLVVLAGLATAASTWVLPWYVRQRCIDVAAEHGIDLSVDHAQMDSGGFRLLGVRAELAAVPGARAQASAVEVATSGLRAQKMTVRGAEVTVEGSFGAVDSAFASWRRSPGGGQAGAWAPPSLVIDGARVVWRAPTGENVRLEAADVHAELAWDDTDDRAPDPELHARSDRVVVAVPSAAFGPWRVDVDRAKGSSRVRIALDPGVPDSCTILVVGNGDRTTSVDIVVPRSPLTRLGWPEQLLGVNWTALQFEASVHYVALGPARADVATRGGLYGVVPQPGFGRAIDAAWEGTASGDPTAGIDVRKARLAFGPLVGALTGTLKRYEDGFRIDLAWAAGPVPCEAFSAPPALGRPFDIAYAIRELARARSLAAPTELARGARAAAESKSGLPAVRGDVSAAAMLSFDSRNIAATKLDLRPEIGCSFFQ